MNVKIKHHVEAITAHIEAALQPPGRAQAVAATFKQVTSLPGAGDVSICDLADDMRRLAEYQRDSADAKLAARARTLAELADVLEEVQRDAWATANPGAGPGRALRWWEAQLEAFGSSDDPRQLVMAQTAHFELSYLSYLAEQAEGVLFYQLTSLPKGRLERVHVEDLKPGDTILVKDYDELLGRDILVQHTVDKVEVGRGGPMPMLRGAAEHVWPAVGADHIAYRIRA